MDSQMQAAKIILKKIEIENTQISDFTSVHLDTIKQQLESLIRKVANC